MALSRLKLIKIAIPFLGSKNKICWCGGKRQKAIEKDRKRIRRKKVFVEETLAKKSGASFI